MIFLFQEMKFDTVIMQYIILNSHHNKLHNLILSPSLSSPWRIAPPCTLFKLRPNFIQYVHHVHCIYYHRLLKSYGFNIEICFIGLLSCFLCVFFHWAAGRNFLKFISPFCIFLLLIVIMVKTLSFHLM